MLYLPPGSAKLIRAQWRPHHRPGNNSIVDFIAKTGQTELRPGNPRQLSQPAANFETESGIERTRNSSSKCIEVIRSEQKASVSLMQRRLRLGYTARRASWMMLENRGIVGPAKAPKPRDILIELDGGGADGGGQQAV